MSRFSADPWRLSLGDAAWGLAGAGQEWIAPIGEGPSMGLDRLGDPSLLRHGRVEVELADNWLRYLVIDWPAGLKGRAEREAWVNERFRAVHGADAAQWVIAVDRAAFADTALASAAPRSLVGALTRFASAHQMRVVSLRGSFVTAYNRLHRGIQGMESAACGALGVCRDGRLTLGLWVHGQWQRVRSVHAGDGAGAVLGTTLASWLPRLATVSADVSGSGVLHVLGVVPEALPPDWRTQAWEASS